MSPRNSAELLSRLTEITQRNLAAGRTFAAMGDAQLQQKPHSKAWNAVECLAHLVHYGNFYLPEVRRRIETTKYNEAQSTYTSSWLGNKFAAGMKPRPKTRKVSTFKSANPINFSTPPDRSVIATFIDQQEELLQLLKMAGGVDLTRTKTSISITRLIKIRLCDTLRVMVYHDWRHVAQAQRAAGVAVTDAEA